jgi:hypothetical protein
MAAYQLFTSTRTTMPDLSALLVALRAIAAEIGIQAFDAQHYKLKKTAAWQASEIASAQTLIDAAADLTPERDAQNQIDAWPIVWKALALTLLDQINILRANDGLAAVTPTQAIAAIRAKAGTL